MSETAETNFLSADQQGYPCDGTSQVKRRIDAQDPLYVSVDERSIQDLLAFSRKYAKELRYLDVQGDALRSTGDWSAFLNEKEDLEEIAEFLQNTETFSEKQARFCRRPHFVLLLTFLRLLRHAQDQLNAFTCRHLNFYYEQVLRMERKTGIPDQVNVLLKPAKDTEQCLFPAGTRLNAGTDRLGKAIIYCTDTDCLVSKAQVARLSSVFAEKRLTGIREAREEYDGPQDEAFMRMLRIALGSPQPGDNLPLHQGRVPEYADLLALYQLVNFASDNLCMDFSMLRSLMRLKRRRDESQAEWDAINALLFKAARYRDSTFDWSIENPRDFEGNFNYAMFEPPNFDGLTEVENIYDLYNQRFRESVQTFIREQLFFEDVDDFCRMMRIKLRIDSEWEEICRILEQAGQRKGILDPTAPDYIALNADLKDANTFQNLLKTALGADIFASLPDTPDLDAYYAALLDIEAYFFLPAEKFACLMQMAQKRQAEYREWQTVYTMLAVAHKRKVYAERRAQLHEIHQQQGLTAMLDATVGHDDTTQHGQDSLLRLSPYLKLSETVALNALNEQLQTGRMTGDDWKEVYRIAEIAQRVYQNLPEPVAQKEEWLNLYAAEDAAAVQAGLGKINGTQHSYWKTFGAGQSAVKKDQIPLTEYGWCICSPVLALSQGNRTITLTLGFRAEEFSADALRELIAEQNPFLIQVSTEKGWLEPETVQIELAGEYHAATGASSDSEAELLPALRLTLFFGSSMDALASFAATEFASQWPALRLTLRHIWQADKETEEAGRYITLYTPFKALLLRKVHISIAVQGLVPSQLQNDEGKLKPDKPFEPFGLQPTAGSHFYIGHPELICKHLDSFDFQLEWMGISEDIKDYYKNYTGAGQNFKGDFTTRISLVDQKNILTLAAEAALFSSAKSSDAHTISFLNFTDAIHRFQPEYIYQPAGQIVLAEDMQAWNRCLLWELNAPDFQHRTYPAAAAARSVDLAAAIANKKSDEKVEATLFQVNPPYTPTLKNLRLDYTASVEVDLTTDALHGQPEQIMHIQPFGHAEVQPESGQVHFLPQFEAEGQLYIGLQQVRVPQHLSLLFQLAEGSADPDLEPQPVAWDYLSGNRWVSLDDGKVLEDGTRGLINSGIIRFDLPPAQPNTLLPAGYYWIRASVPVHADSLCDTVAIHAQAVSATFMDQDNAPDHLQAPLAEESITELADHFPEIAGVLQPYTSFGGKMPEQDSSFRTRISERLRHKNRALTAWDYEHLVLEQFPEIYKVKCLPARSDKPAQVDIIVIPDIKNKLPCNPFEPKAPTDLLADVKDFLAARCSPFTELKVRNARYVAVKTRFAVRFLPGHNPGYYTQLLNTELNRFLSPWAYDQGADVVISGRIYANSIVNFLEERPYVDYVAQLKLYSSEDGRTFQPVLPLPSGDYWIEAPGPASVLAAAPEHDISIIPETGYDEESYHGINFMKIEFDFIVG